MRNTNLEIQDIGLDVDGLKGLIDNMFNYQIRQCQSKFLTDWEADHSTSTKRRDERIAQLRENKKKVFSALEKHSSQDSILGLKISVQLEGEGKESLNTRSESLLAS